jgi:hypothetical protein
MMARVRSQKDLAAGLVFMAFAALFWLGARGIPAGTAARMDAGYMPMLLSTLLGLLGAACALRAFFVGDPEEGRIGRIPLRPVCAVAGAVLLFALTLDLLGFPPAMFAALVLVALGGAKPRPVEIVAAAAILTAFGWFVFIRLLGIQLPMGWF